MGKDEMKKMLLCMARDACLADHMGDMWNSICDAATALGLELPEQDGGYMDLDGIEKMGGVRLSKFVKEASPRNYPVPEEIEQVLVKCCDDCPCLVVEDDKLCSLMPPETEGTDRRGRKFIVQHEITVDTSEQVDPECPLKKKHHILMLSTTED